LPFLPRVSLSVAIDAVHTDFRLFWQQNAMLFVLSPASWIPGRIHWTYTFGFGNSLPGVSDYSGRRAIVFVLAFSELPYAIDSLLNSFNNAHVFGH
jgi:hypothetical protein